MKRDRFASDYERVRRQAGLPGPEFPLDGKEDAHVDLARVDAAHEDFKARMSAYTEHDSEQARKRAAEATALTLRANESLRLAEFARAGVEPPVGCTSSLGLLLQIGWTIGRNGDGRVLLRPALKPEPQRRKTREDHAAESLREGF